MKNLTAVIEGKTLSALKGVKVKSKSNFIEPTKIEIGKILTALKAGKTVKEISRTIYREKGEAKLSFSKGQIREVIKAREKRIAELEEPLTV